MKNNYLTHIPAILLMAAAFVNAACEDETDTPDDSNLTAEEWIVNFLHTEYLWNDEAKEKTPDKGRNVPQTEKREEMVWRRSSMTCHSRCLPTAPAGSATRWWM